MSTTVDNDGSMSCANCGKEGDNLNTCNKCNLVKYCNAACKKKHRSKHKKKCDRRVAELHDEALFKQPPPEDECPICFLRKPTLHTGYGYYTCCGKTICRGCLHAGANMEGNADELCPYCRAPAPTEEEAIERVRKRVEVDDAKAVNNLGCHYYCGGRRGVPQDRDKALELWHRAAELGHAGAYHNIGNAYSVGRGVERDEKKANYYYELAAMGGTEYARHNLGCVDFHAGNIERALKHFMIAVGSGYHGSLKSIQLMCKDGHATKDDYSNALQTYQAYLEEIKSDDRDKAAAFDDGYKYYE